MKAKIQGGVIILISLSPVVDFMNTSGQYLGNADFSLKSGYLQSLNRNKGA